MVDLSHCPRLLVQECTTGQRALTLTLPQAPKHSAKQLWEQGCQIQQIKIQGTLLYNKHYFQFKCVPCLIYILIFLKLFTIYLKFKCSQLSLIYLATPVYKQDIIYFSLHDRITFYYTQPNYVKYSIIQEYPKHKRELEDVTKVNISHS